MPSYWDKSNSFFVYWQKRLNRWAIGDRKVYDSVMQGECPGWAYREDAKHFANATGWTESRGHGVWKAAVLETSVSSSCKHGLKVAYSGFSKDELNVEYT